MLLRNPRREVEIEGGRTVRNAARRARPRPRVPPRDPQRHARAGRRRARRCRHRRDPPRDLRRLTACPSVGCAGGRRHRPAAAQRQLLRRAPPAAVPPPGREGDRRPRHAAARRPCARGGQRRQGLARRVGHPARARLRGRRAVHRARHRRVQRRQRRATPRRSPPSAGCRCAPSTCATSTATTSRPPPGRPAGAVLGVRAVEAPPVRQRRPRRRLRRRGHRSQPRRRGRRAARQHAALGRRLPRPPAAGAPGERRLPAEGQAARAAHRARDRRVVHRARHRLPGRGVPDGGRQPAPRVQGGAQRSRAHARPARRRRSTSASSSAWRRCSPADRDADVDGLGHVLAVRRADDRRGLRVLPARRDGSAPRARSPIEMLTRRAVGRR